MTRATCASCGEPCGDGEAVPVAALADAVGSRFQDLRLPVCASCVDALGSLDLVAYSDAFGWDVQPAEA